MDLELWHMPLLQIQRGQQSSGSQGFQRNQSFAAKRYTSPGLASGDPSKASLDLTNI
jgi:hypothetical protein